MPNIILYWQIILSAISVTLFICFICFKIWKCFVYFQLIFEFRLWVCSQMFGPTLYAPLVPGTNDMSSFKFNGVRDWSPYLGRCLSDCVWVWPAMFELGTHSQNVCIKQTHIKLNGVVFLCHFGVCIFRFAYTLRVKCPHSLWGNVIFPYELKIIKNLANHTWITI